VIEIEYLDLEDVVEMVRILMVGPIRDVGLLDSAVNRPRSSAFGDDAYLTLELKAACSSSFHDEETTRLSMAIRGLRGSALLCL